MRKTNEIVSLFLGTFVVLAALSFGGVKLAGVLLNKDTVVATVTEKGERCSSKESCKYLIYTDKGTFENTDSWVAWKFNSSDVYGAVAVNHTYEFKLQGTRVQFLSWYQNITSATEVK